MRAGTLTDRVTIQRPVTADDPAWGPSGSWSDVGEAWASVTETADTETPASNGVRSESTFEIQMRFRRDVTSANRLIYRGRVLDLLSVIDVGGAGRELAIVAKEHPAAAPQEVANG